MINIKEFFEYLVSIRKIFTFDKRIDKLEKELAKALDKANNNKLHCPQCGGDVEIVQERIFSYDTNYRPNYEYTYKCKECNYKGVRTK